MTPEGLARTHAAAFGAHAWDTATLGDYLDKPFCHVLGDETCFAVLQVIAEEAEILTLATHPDARRQGRAKALLATARAEVKRMGGQQIYLDVSDTNTAAIALYESAGYVRFSERRNYYKDGSTALCMKVGL